MKRYPKPHDDHSDSRGRTVTHQHGYPCEQRWQHAVGQVYPVRFRWAALGKGEPPACTPQEGKYGCAISQLSIGQFWAVELAHCHDQRGGHKGNEPRKAKNQRRFGTFPQVSHVIAKQVQLPGRRLGVCTPFQSHRRQVDMLAPHEIRSLRKVEKFNPPPSQGNMILGKMFPCCESWTDRQRGSTPSNWR